MAIYCGNFFFHLNFPANQSLHCDYWLYFKIKLDCHGSIFAVLRKTFPRKLSENVELYVIEKYSNI